uniref:hypothetical protein n=1 Tax=Nocardia brasiliensis TaxID=37326 RepID=UPI00245712F8
YVVIHSDLIANEPRGAQHGDPRAAARLDRPLVSDFAAARDFQAVLAFCRGFRAPRMLFAARPPESYPAAVLDLVTAPQQTQKKFDSPAR